MRRYGDELGATPMESERLTVTVEEAAAVLGISRNLAHEFVTRAVQSAPSRSRSRSSRFRVLPAAFRGSWRTKTTCFGFL